MIDAFWPFLAVDSRDAMTIFKFLGQRPSHKPIPSKTKCKRPLGNLSAYSQTALGFSMSDFTKF